MDICPRTSSEENGKSAGFFFYRTREGYNFRSMKDLIDQPITETYTYGGTHLMMYMNQRHLLVDKILKEF